MLISTHMQDLKDVTQDVHYENFRAQCISQISQHAMRERGYVYFFCRIHVCKVCYALAVANENYYVKKKLKKKRKRSGSIRINNYTRFFALII